MNLIGSDYVWWNWFKNLNLNDMLNQFQDMAKNLKMKMLQNIYSKAGGGMVEISINGNSEVIDLKLMIHYLRIKILYKFC